MKFARKRLFFALLAAALVVAAANLSLVAPLEAGGHPSRACSSCNKPVVPVTA